MTGTQRSTRCDEQLSDAVIEAVPHANTRVAESSLRVDAPLRKQIQRPAIPYLRH